MLRTLPVREVFLFLLPEEGNIQAILQHFLLRYSFFWDEEFSFMYIYITNAMFWQQEKSSFSKCLWNPKCSCIEMLSSEKFPIKVSQNMSSLSATSNELFLPRLYPDLYLNAIIQI